MTSDGRKWTTEFVTSARRDLRAISQPVALRILKKLAALELDPKGMGTTELVDDPGFRRLRVGDYRVIYTLDHDRIVVLVVAVGPRSAVYRHVSERTRAAGRS